MVRVKREVASPAFKKQVEAGHSGCFQGRGSYPPAMLDAIAPWPQIV